MDLEAILAAVTRPIPPPYRPPPKPRKSWKGIQVGARLTVGEGAPRGWPPPGSQLEVATANTDGCWLRPTHPPGGLLRQWADDWPSWLTKLKKREWK